MAFPRAVFYSCSLEGCPSLPSTQTSAALLTFGGAGVDRICLSQSFWLHGEPFSFSHCAISLAAILLFPFPFPLPFSFLSLFALRLSSPAEPFRTPHSCPHHVPVSGQPVAAARGGSSARALAGGFHGMGRKSLGWVQVSGDPSPSSQAFLLLAGCPEARGGRHSQTSLQRTRALPAAFSQPCPDPGTLPGTEAWALWPGSVVGCRRGVPRVGKGLWLFLTSQLCGHSHGKGRGEGGQGSVGASSNGGTTAPQ